MQPRLCEPHSDGLDAARAGEGVDLTPERGDGDGEDDGDGARDEGPVEDREEFCGRVHRGVGAAEAWRATSRRCTGILQYTEGSWNLRDIVAAITEVYPDGLPDPMFLKPRSTPPCQTTPPEVGEEKKI